MLLSILVVKHIVHVIIKLFTSAFINSIIDSLTMLLLCVDPWGVNCAPYSSHPESLRFIQRVLVLRHLSQPVCSCRALP